MFHRSIIVALMLLVVIGQTSTAGVQAVGHALPSWNDGPARQSILDFVARVTNEGSPDFVPVAERIAVFDNDGTLWSEQPMYVQLAFVIDRVKALASANPTWKDTEPFKSVLAGDIKGVAAMGENGAAQLLAATHAGMTTEEFSAIVSAWIETAKHPKFNRPYTEMVFQPMLEVLALLRDHGFKTYIVSGGGVEFMRPWAERVYGIPPEQVVGSRGKLKFEMKDGNPVLIKLPEIDLVNDGPGKPVGIQQLIGRRPIMAFGNSDGDLQMLQWTMSGEGPRFAVIIHHDDAARETAYDRDSHIGKLDKAWDEANQRGWTVVSMKNDWSTIFPAVGTPSLQNKRWTLTALNGKPAAPAEDGPGAFLEFLTGSIAGSGGVNRFSGMWTLEGDRLTINPGAMTMMAGPEPLMQQESEFVAALMKVKAFRIDGDRLELSSESGPIATFVASDVPPNE